MKLLTNEQGKSQGFKTLVAAKYASTNIEVVSAEVKSADFLSKSPLGKTPVLETDNGSIFEPNASARYIAKSGNKLYGSNSFEAALVDQWIDFSVSEIDLPASVWVYPILGYIQNNPAATQKAKADLRKVLEILNKHLQDRTFLVGERISLADIVVSMSLLRLYERVLEPNFRKSFVNVDRWFLTCINQPEFSSVIGQVKLCTKMEVAPASESKPKKEKAKKEEKPKKKETEDLEAAAEKEGKEDKKKKNPLDELPPTSFVLDEWKRTYSNNDTITVANPWFWEHLDKEGWSVWFADYKYNDELEKAFMTSNLLGGFIQRLDKLRKYGFGSLIIFGDEPKLEISTCWLFRGQDIPAEMKDCDDSEHYNWRKADLSDSATREQINAYWAWENFPSGKKFNQGKIFK